MINKHFFNYSNYNSFLSDKESGNIPNDAICFIKDKEIIYTHGVEYNSVTYKIGDITAIDTSDVSSINDVLGTVSDLRSAISNKKFIIAQTEVGVFPVICSDESSYITLSVTVGKGMGYYTVSYAGTEWTSMSVDSVEFATKDDITSGGSMFDGNILKFTGSTSSFNENILKL